jgi:hypothetical protein
MRFALSSLSSLSSKLVGASRSLHFSPKSEHRLALRALFTSLQSLSIASRFALSSLLSKVGWRFALSSLSSKLVMRFALSSLSSKVGWRFALSSLSSKLVMRFALSSLLSKVGWRFALSSLSSKVGHALRALFTSLQSLSIALQSLGHLPKDAAGL